MATTFLKAKNDAIGHLNASITAAALSLTLRSGEGALFPTTYPFHITINTEILEVSNNASDVLTVTRAKESTTAAIHLIGAVVSLNITAQVISDLNDAINALEGLNPSGLGGLNPGDDIQAAIDIVYAAGGGEVLLKKGTFTITNLTIPNGVTLKGAGSDATIISLTGTITITGGSENTGNAGSGHLVGVRVSVPSGYTGTAILIDGTTVAIGESLKILDDVHIRCLTDTGTMIKLLANGTNSVGLCTFGDIYIWRGEYGIKLSASGTGWVNGNIFGKVVIWGSVYGIHTDGGGNGTDGNHFLDYQYEGYTGSVNAFKIKGASNIIESMESWDMTGKDDGIIDTGSRYNYIKGYFTGNSVIDNASGDISYESTNTIIYLGGIHYLPRISLGRGGIELSNLKHLSLAMPQNFQPYLLWTFQEGAIGYPFDLSGNNRIAHEIGGNATYVVPKTGWKTFDLTGDGNYIYSESPVSMAGDKTIIIGCIPDFASDDAKENSLVHWKVDANNEMYLYKYPGLDRVYYRAKANGTGQSSAFFAGGFAAGDPLVFVITLDSVNNQYKIYHRGVLQATVAIGTMTASLDEIYVGCIVGAAGATMWDGKIGYVAMLDRCLDAVEVARVTNDVMLMLGSKPLKNSGTATITGAVTTVDVTHGLATTPTRVFITPLQTGQGDYAVTAKGATTFTITFTTQPGASTWTFDWRAQVGEG